MIIKSDKVQNFIKRSGEVIHSPEQRLIVGVTAMASQPFIDMNNKKADEDTRIISTCRTMAKIIAGTTSGVVVRALCIKGVKELSKPGKLLDPIKLSKNSVESIASKLESYNKTLGTFIAIGVMLVTNFLWDAPVAKHLTNFFYSKATKKKEAKQ